MTSIAPNLGLTTDFVLEQDGWGEAYNADMLKLSIFAQLSVISRVSILPLAPAEGSVYLFVQDSNSLIHDNSNSVLDDSNSAGSLAFRDTIAVFWHGVWLFYSPFPGMRAYVQSETAEYLFTNDDWILQTTGSSAATVSYESGDPGDSDSTATTVQTALDDLYSENNAQDVSIFDIDSRLSVLETRDASSNSFGVPTDAAHLTYQNTLDSNSLPITIEEALDALFAGSGGGGGSTAADVSYDSGDPGDSDSTATNVQTALDDLYAENNAQDLLILNLESRISVFEVRDESSNSFGMGEGGGGSSDASGITYQNSLDSNSAPITVEQALDALFAGGGSGGFTAADISYDSLDPGDSDSTATNVQTALDDLYAENNAQDLQIANLASASGITYQNSLDSNSTPITVEQALDALFDRPYPVGMFFEGSTADQSKTRHHVVALPIRIPADFVGSVGWAENSDDTDLVITILKNGVVIGTATFSGDSNSNFSAVTFDAASPSNSDVDFGFVPGDRMSFLLPASFGSWNDIGLTILAARTA